MIKINLVREGRAAVRGAAAPGGGGGGGAAAPSGPSNINNTLIIIFVVIGLLVSGGYYLLKDRQRTAKQNQVELEKQEAQRLEKIIKEVEEFQRRKDSLENRINLINQLKQNQKGPVRLLDQISRDLPDLVWLDQMQVDSGKISLSGRALNPNAFAYYVDNIKQDPMFDEPEPGEVRQVSTTNGPNVYTWTMKFNFKWAPAVAAGTTAATGTAAPAGSAPATATSTAAPKS